MSRVRASGARLDSQQRAVVLVGEHVNEPVGTLAHVADALMQLGQQLPDSPENSSSTCVSALPENFARINETMLARRTGGFASGSGAFPGLLNVK
jgi:hypothetical protein